MNTELGSKAKWWRDISSEGGGITCLPTRYPYIETKYVVKNSGFLIYDQLGHAGHGCGTWDANQPKVFLFASPKVPIRVEEKAEEVLLLSVRPA